MKRIIVATLLPVLLAAMSSCVQSTKPIAGRTTPGPITDHAAWLDELLPGMGAPNLADRQTSQQEFEQMCFRAGRPGADGERTALCQAIIARLGPETAQPARVWMLRQLERIGGEESVAALAKLLEDEDQRIRELARRALQKNPAPAALVALGAALERARDSAWQVALINALAARHDAAAWKWLLPLTEAENTKVADAAIAALGGGGP